MKTKILKISPLNPEMEKIKAAAEVIKKGGLVAFPTETVYGLGANALNAKSVKKIFKAKGRPSDNPLIVHIASHDGVRSLAKNIPDVAKKLMKVFWPGPLTLVLEKTDAVPKETTGGLDTVAIRFPNHPVARTLIKEAGVPIAAPSANASGRPSPTSARHVIEDLDGKIDVIIDGGDTEHGLESTVVDVTGVPTLLRPGIVTLEALKEAIGEVVVLKKHEDAAKSPGMKYRHYAPRAEVIIAENRNALKRTVEELTKQNKRVGVVTADAKNLFRKFRESDAAGMDAIVAESVKEEHVGRAVMDRLRRAAKKVVK